jgi:hypothetical protein
MSVVRLSLPSWDMVNKQGQRWILAGITPAWTIHLHLLYTSYSSQHSAQHERQMFNDKFSIHRTEVQDCQQLLQLSWPFHSNCISHAMLVIPTTCLLHTDPVHNVERLHPPSKQGQIAHTLSEQTFIDPSNLSTQWTSLQILSCKNSVTQ